MSDSDDTKGSWKARRSADHLTDAEILEIKYSRDAYDALARKFKVSEFAITLIKSGISHSHIGPTERGWKRTSEPSSDYLTEADIQEIKTSSASDDKLAGQHGVSSFTIRRIRIKCGRISPYRKITRMGWSGGARPPSKINNLDVAHAILNSKKSNSKLAKIYGVSRESIRRIRDGYSWPKPGPGWKRRLGKDTGYEEIDRDCLKRPPFRPTTLGG